MEENKPPQSAINNAIDALYWMIKDRSLLVNFIILLSVLCAWFGADNILARFDMLIAAIQIDIGVP